jgi:MipA family protein
MRRLICLAVGASCLSSPTFAQSAPPASGLPSAQDLASRDMYTLGIGAAAIADYEGSDDYRVIPVAAIRAKVHGISISTNGPYLTVDLFPQSTKFNFDAGPIAGFRFDSRRHSDDGVVRMMVRRNTAYEVGGFAGVSFHGLVDPYDTLAFRIDVLHDVGSAHKSTVFDPHVDFSTPVSRKTYVSASIGAEFVGSRFANYYFGVTPADVIATGGALPLYSPAGGMKNWKSSLLVNQSITGDLLGGLSVFGFGQYSRLLGHFKRSPIVSMRGNASQWTGAVGLAYTW